MVTDMEKTQKIKKTLKKLVSLALTIAIVLTMLPVSVKAAESAKWVPLGGGRHQLEGTDVIVEIAPGTVHLTGSGAVPDYGYWDMNKRPWHTSECVSLVVDDTITSIGSYAFYQMSKLKYITISSQTFIKDTTVFGKNAQNPVFRIGGSQVRSEMFGNVPYTSLDSIKAFAQGGWGGSYVLDDGANAKAFQESTNPTIPFVYSATDAAAPWNDLNLNRNGNVYTSLCSPRTPDPGYTVTGMKKYQGRQSYEIFGALAADYSFVATYEIVVNRNDAKKTKITETSAPKQYVFSIPKEFQKDGRTFRLLSIGKDQFFNYEDLDTATGTITFETSQPSAAYALIYKDL